MTDASRSISSHSSTLGPELTRALTERGFESLTAVQEAVLDPSLDGRDMRVTSQTGSGKTVAIGLAVRSFVMQAPGSSSGKRRDEGFAHPRAMVVAPTRELAKQVEEELSWLYAATGARVVSVIGGASARDERRALGTRPAVVVGTPGRLLDHLRRGAIDAKSVGAVVLDEADRLLDMGFREDLEAILGFVPEGHRTHLVSATFPREVQALANATQDDPVHVEGTRLGVANADIDHVIHLVDPRQRLDALVNLLLANPDEQTLVFARTRADVATVANELAEAGFSAAPISGEMDQPARNRALAAFRRGDLRVLVATDVAARGIDVQDIARVVHGEPPGDVDSYTHRSGRTGRAGRKGTSSVLVTPAELPKTVRLLARAGVVHRFEPVP
ncbi:MAG: DEAD/DEAH box helicase, partial [Polyangiaceae bacterium]